MVTEECQRTVIPIPNMGGGGGSYSAPARPAPAQQPLAPGAHRIDDPDQPIEGQIIDYVWGNDSDDAARKCRAIAANAGARYVGVKATSRGGKKYECHVQTNHPEPEPGYNSGTIPRYDNRGVDPKTTDDRIRDPNGR